MLRQVLQIHRPGVNAPALRLSHPLNLEFSPIQLWLRPLPRVHMPAHAGSHIRLAPWRAVITILFAPAVGRWIDHGDRLVVVRDFIVGERLATAAPCLLLLALTRQRNSSVSWLASGLFAAVIILAGAEKLCSVMNSVAVTKDWVRPLV